MSDDIDFTVVIPTCNRPLMLPRALASALRQTHDRYEIVVVDDASDDQVVIESPNVRRVTVLRSPRRLGFAGAINLGAMHAKGRWIAFLDDDDEYEPDLLRQTRARFQAMPDRQFSLCSTAIMHYDGHDRPVREFIRRFSEVYESEDELLSATISVGSGYGFTVNGQVFRDLGGFDESYWAIADTEFFFRLIAAGYRPAMISEQLMRVHKHSGPRMTDPRSYRHRAQQCERLSITYANVIGKHPQLGDYIRTSVDRLTSMALACESQHGRA